MSAPIPPAPGYQMIDAISNMMRDLARMEGQRDYWKDEHEKMTKERDYYRDLYRTVTDKLVDFNVEIGALIRQTTERRNMENQKQLTHSGASVKELEELETHIEKELPK